MTEHDDMVLSAAERAALAIERERPSFDGDAAERMLRRLQLAVAVAPGAPDGGSGGGSDGGGPAPPAAPSPPTPPAGSAGGVAALGSAATGGLAKLGAVFALGLAVGGAGVGVALQRPAAPVAFDARPAASIAAAPVSSASAVIAGGDDAAAPVWSVSDLPSRPEPPRPSERPEPSAPDPAALVAESQLIDGVRTALGRGDAAAALALLDQHGARFPRGALAEEAGALRVRALRTAGRAAEADRAAREFLVRYPNSLFRPMVSP